MSIKIVHNYQEEFDDAPRGEIVEINDNKQ